MPDHGRCHIFRVIGRLHGQQQSNDVTGCEQHEYSALRATIRDRGTARVWIFLIGISGWAALFIAAIAVGLPPVESVAPLLVLAAAFEAVYALHVGVERIGRYLQVYYETETGSGTALTPAWEHTAMSFGRPRGSAGAGVDPLFAVMFVLAAVLNLFAANPASATREELLFVGAAHGLFVLRVARARAVAAKQRAIDRDHSAPVRSAQACRLSRSTGS